ncbi:MAG TPA: Gfo/Idh/MocA family oxidoreductase [Abditibacteriaceae bacterium]|jgi:predicted dehydrogenase
MSNTLKVGVIGVGGIANSHYPGWEASPHTELAAFADMQPQVLTRLADKYNVSRRYADAMELIGDPDVDIVDICTPSAFHAPLAIAALEAGKHVICEKPLAPTPDEIRSLIAARDKSGKLLMTAQHFRFQSSAQALKAQLQGGTLGDVYHARAWMLRRAWLPTGPGFIYKKNSGGGPCIDIGVHILDLTLWMMGHPKPVSVTGVTQDKLSKLPGAFSLWGGAVPADMDVEEFAGAFVRFENGATLMLEVSWLLHHATTGEDMQMWLYGTGGGAHWPGNSVIKANNETKSLTTTSLDMVPGAMEPHALECVKFAEAIVEGKPSPVPPEESLDVQLILNGLYRSAEEKREVRLDA